MDPDAIFEAIRRTFERTVSITTMSHERMKGRGGYHWERGGRHHVWIHESLVGTARLVVLTHELGHYRSALNGRSAIYEEAIKGERSTWVDCPEEQRRAVLDEEVRAYQHGLAIAVEHELDDATEFLEIARADLENYRDKVDLPVEVFEEARAALALPRS